MAEHGAHLTSSSTQDVDKPNIFEVLAQENLTTTIRPAIKHAVRVFAEKYPAQLGPVLRFYDEIFLSLDGLLQLHYLSKWGSSFAENFYDLTRCSSKQPELTKLPKSLRLKALACLVLIPYIRQKLDSQFEEWRYAIGDVHWKSLIQPKLTLYQRFVRLCLLLYPYIYSSWEFINLLCQLSYMLRGGKWHSISMYLSGTELRRAPPDSNSDQNVTRDKVSMESFNARLAYFVKTFMNAAGVFLASGLSVAVFFLQFLEWWYASDTSAPSLTALPIPKPPEVNCDVQELEDCSKCPICQNERSNSTALSVSGYVFCYTCINQYVRNNRCCPVTGYPATYEHLVKIYEQDM